MNVGDRANDRANDRVNDRVILTKTELAVFRLIEENGEFTALEISEKIHVTELTVRRVFKSLKEKSIIERVGSDKTGYWKIKS